LHEQLVDSSPGRRLAEMNQLQGIRQGEKEKMAEFIARLELLSRRVLHSDRYSTEAASEILVAIFTRAVVSKKLRKKLSEAISSFSNNPYSTFHDLKKLALNFELNATQYRELELTRKGANCLHRNNDTSPTDRIATAKSALSPDEPTLQCHIHPKLRHTNEHCLLQQRQKKEAQFAPPGTRLIVAAEQPRITRLTSHSQQQIGRNGSVVCPPSSDSHPVNLVSPSNGQKCYSSSLFAPNLTYSQLFVSGRGAPFPPPGKVSTRNPSLGTPENLSPIPNPSQHLVSPRCFPISSPRKMRSPESPRRNHQFLPESTVLTHVGTNGVIGFNSPSISSLSNIPQMHLPTLVAGTSNTIPKLLSLPYIRPSTLSYPHNINNTFSSLINGKWERYGGGWKKRKTLLPTPICNGCETHLTSSDSHLLITDTPISTRRTVWRRSSMEKTNRRREIYDATTRDATTSHEVMRFFSVRGDVGPIEP
jgi:hypothetical protein